jgi:hypothetical protein
MDLNGLVELGEFDFLKQRNGFFQCVRLGPQLAAGG